MSASRQAVLLDTDVFSALYVQRGNSDPRVAGWRRLLTGRLVVISFQTRAESLSGALIANWGERKLTSHRAILDRTPTVSVDDTVVECFARLQAQCRADGHALHNKVHNADRWIAACAVAKGLPLLAGDQIFHDVPELELVEGR